MDEDSFRKKLDFEMYCSKHHKERLSFSTELSSVGARSSYEVNVKIVVHPCEKCQLEIENVKNAVSTILSFKK